MEREAIGITGVDHEMEPTRAEFDARMAEGLCQAECGDVSPVADVRKRIMGELQRLAF